MIPDYVRQYELLEKSHWWWKARREIIKRKLLTLSAGRRLNGKFSLLDMGCGSGITLKSLKDDFECYGLEPDPLLVERARQNSEVPVLQGALPQAVPDFGRKFDFVLLLDVLEHIEDDVKALQTVKSMLNPGGQIIINVPAFSFLWSIHDEVNEHKRRYEVDKLKTKIQSAGLKLRSVEFWCTCFFLIVYLVRKCFARKTTSMQHYRVRIPPRAINLFLERFVVFEHSFLQRVQAPFGLSLMVVME